MGWIFWLPNGWLTRRKGEDSNPIEGVRVKTDFFFVKTLVKHYRTHSCTRCKIHGQSRVPYSWAPRGLCFSSK